MRIQRHTVAWSHTATLALPNLGNRKYRLAAVAIGGTTAVTVTYELRVLNGAGQLAFSTRAAILATTGAGAILASNATVMLLSSPRDVGFLPPDLWIEPGDAIQIIPSGVPDASVGPVVFTTEPEEE